MKSAITCSRKTALAALALTAAVTGLSAAVAGSIHASATGSSHGRKPDLAGTWLVQVTRRDCQSGVEIESFQAMNSFDAAGSLVEFGTTPTVTPGMRTPGLGDWERTGPRRYRAVFSLFFLPDGVNVGSLHRIERVITLTAWNQFNADAKVKILDPSGAAVLATGCATEIARRIS